MVKKRDNCAKELRQIATRIQEQAPSDWKPQEVCQKCVLHRWITPDLYDEQSGEILPAAVVDDRLSVIAECASCSFGKVNLNEAAKQAADEQGLTIIGSIRLPASFFIEHWQIKHDPFKYIVRGEQKNAHPNHVQVICEKGFDVYEQLGPLEWHVKPGAPFPESGKQPWPDRLKKAAITKGLVWLIILLLLGLIWDRLRK